MASNSTSQLQQQVSPSSPSIKMEPNESVENKMIRHDLHYDLLDQELQTFRQQGVLTDFVIISGEQTLHAHKLILAIYSTQIRQHVLAGESVLDLSDVNPEVVSSLLAFIYQGEVEIRAELLEDLLALGARLDVAGLSAIGLVEGNDNGQQIPKKKKAPRQKRTNSDTTNTDKKKKLIATNAIQRFEKRDPEYIRSSDNTQFVCAYCYAAFGSKSGVARHVLLHTGGLKEIHCFQCEYKSLQKADVKRHAIKRHQIDGKVFDTIMKQRLSANVDPMPGPSNHTPGPSNPTPGPSNAVPKTNKKLDNGRKSSFAKGIKSEPKDVDPLYIPGR